MRARFPHFVFLLIIFSTNQFLRSQSLESSPNDWENPAIFEKGQNDPHAFHIPFSSIESALLDQSSSCENYILLNGLWDFKWVERPDLVPQNFQDPKFNSKKWDKIRVPSNWQMEGYGHPKFRNVALSFESDPPNIPDYYNPTACYKRTFSFPSGWENKEVMLRFEGIKSASYVWINGQLIGYNQGGFEPAEYNITTYLKKGKNDISVEVIRFCDGSYLENQDMWRLSGIFRDVILYAQPKVHITDFYQTTDLDENFRDARLNIDVHLRNSLPEPVSGFSLEVDVMDGTGKSILDERFTVPEIDFATQASKIVRLATMVKDPDKWSSETPNLYTILYSLKNERGIVVEAFTKKLGFKEVEVNGVLLTVNGKAVKLNGVNSHMHHPDHGQAVPLETLKQDLLLMKQNNINAVRTCHYPPTPEYLDMADELGVYIIDEVGDEAHGNIQLSYDSSFTEMYRDRSRKLVCRDRNHASVIIWSAGNESGSGFNIHEVIKTGKAIDPSRPAWMYGGNTFYIPFEDITGPRYWTPYQLKNLAEGNVLGKDDLRPSFMDEYLAATGNGLGGLDEYWELIWQYPRLLGGAIWDWISPGITTPLWITSDASSNHIDGAIMGRPVFVAGKVGRGISFTGHDDWIEFYRDPALDITGNEISISFWVNPKKIPQANTFISKGAHAYGMRMQSFDTLEFWIQGNNLNTIYQTPYYKPSSKRIAVKTNVPSNWYDNWHHLAGIYNGETLKIYIDKTEYASVKYSGTIADSPFPLCIGRDAEIQDQGEYSGRLSSMIIDDVWIYDKAVEVDNLLSGKSNIPAVLALDFEQDRKEGTFYAVGLGGRTYGIVWPDRSVQPELYQVKKSAQPIAVLPVDLKNGVVKLINRHRFTNLDKFDLVWEVMRGGEPVENGKLNISLDPEESMEVKIPYSRLKSSGELILTLSFRLKEKCNWATEGHEVAWEQFILQESMMEYPVNEAPDISLSESGDKFIIKGENFEYSIMKENGMLSNLLFKGKIYLESGPLFNIWRAPLANDIDPWGSYLTSDEFKTVGLGRSIDNQLRTLGLKDLSVQVMGIESSKEEGRVSVMVHKYYNSSNLRGAFECRENYIFHGDGTIDINFIVIPHSRMPDFLPKVGWQFSVPKSFSEIEWYGRGPFETYPDRKTGAKIGRYSSDVNKEYVPYIIPQDYGNHTDVRWVKVEDEMGRGFEISTGETLNFSYHKYSTENLSRAMYTYQLKDAPENTLNIDSEVSGVGGTAIRQLERYKVKAGELEFGFSLKPF